MIVLNRELCGYCGACVSVCHRDALDLSDLDLKIDQAKCDGCRICVKICPLSALEENDEAKEV